MRTRLITQIKRTIDRVTLISIATIIGAVLIVVTTPQITAQIKTVAKYPATACPSNLSDATAVATLTNSKALVREIPAKSAKLSSAKVANYALGTNPLLIDGNANSSLAVIKNSSGALATGICTISTGDQWFVGGSGTVLSRGSIVIVNSGLSAATVDLLPFTSKAALAAVTQVVKPNSQLKVPIDSLAPGEDSIVIHAITRSGRASTYLFDDRHKGLHQLGVDFVSPVSSPTTHLVIPAISNVGIGKSAPTQSLRVLIPGAIDASIKANIYSTDGSFAPIEIDGKNIKHGQVFDLPFKPVVNAKNYSLVIDSDQPLVAAVLTVAGSDFTWATGAPQLINAGFNLGGLTPSVEFVGANISVQMSWLDINGRTGSQSLTASDFATWTPKNGIARINFKSNGKSYGAIIFGNGFARASIPMTSGASLENSALPATDARVISRG